MTLVDERPRDINAWFRQEGWNFAHRLETNDPTFTLCRRYVGEIDIERYAAEPTDERCPTCSKILASGAL